MSTLAVAEKDFRDAIRSRLIIAVILIFVVFTAGAVAVGQAFGIENTIIQLLLFLMVRGMSIFVPLVALGIAFRSIAGERDSGSLKILLSLPNSRLDVVLGKFLGRTGVMGVAVVIGFVAMLVAVAMTFPGNTQGDVILTFMLAAMLLAVVFVSIAVSVSAFTRSTFSAAIGCFGLFVLFRFAWGGMILLLRYVANGFDAPSFTEAPPEWAQVLNVVNPITGWRQATRWLLRRVSEQESTQSAADAFYLEPWFGFVVLAFWIVLPLAVGYLRFESADL